MDLRGCGSRPLQSRGPWTDEWSWADVVAARQQGLWDGYFSQLEEATLRALSTVSGLHNKVCKLQCLKCLEEELQRNRPTTLALLDSSMEREEEAGSMLQARPVHPRDTRLLF